MKTLDQYARNGAARREIIRFLWSRLGNVFRLLLVVSVCTAAEEVSLPGLEKPVEILRDRWGVPHIYAQSAGDLFFAQGWITARDRLFQIDLWRRTGTGKLAEVLGPQALGRDRIARLVRFRGDWQAEWSSYSPDAQAIATASTSGINAYIRAYIQAPGGKRPLEFRIAGYDPGLWQPEDVASRIAGLLMTRNITREVARAADIESFGLEKVQTYLPPDPLIKIEIPHGLDLAGITASILGDYNQAIGSVRFPDQGSNNWVVSGARSLTGKPLLASDPHRPVLIPSLRKTVHLVAPGWNVIGAGEPALPGIALGHNEEAAFGFTIVGIDQADLFVEKLNPANPNQYEYQGGWRNMAVASEEIAVRGEPRPRKVALRYTNHGPVIAEDPGRHRAYALHWVGSQPGSAGYLAALSLSRARNWEEFQAGAARYKIPSENLLYADRAGNIGWIAAGLAPIRKKGSGLLPVPGHTSEYEWTGFLPASRMPRLFNPPSATIATANHNILPPGYPHPLGYEWALRFRKDRIDEMLKEKTKFSIQDFQRMQQDVVSHPARIFQAILRRWQVRRQDLQPKEWDILQRLRQWDARIEAQSSEAMVFEFWLSRLPALVFGQALGARTDVRVLLSSLERTPNPHALLVSLRSTIQDLERLMGASPAEWKWGNLHTIHFRHPLGVASMHRGPIARPGDSNTVNATSSTNFKQTSGASYRQILDLSDWDKSVMTNAPGESGDPNSPHYSDLLEDWASGNYHPMPYSRKAVEAATVERIHLTPGGPARR
ncbi:MAG: penicillin acylase family protein [Acidobacteriia bacterium]|nr:penicillin acylase family protein [Terriglobia bacterium]